MNDLKNCLKEKVLLLLPYTDDDCESSLSKPKVKSTPTNESSSVDVTISVKTKKTK